MLTYCSGKTHQYKVKLSGLTVQTLDVRIHLYIGRIQYSTATQNMTSAALLWSNI